jgi:hypothetical protein
MDATFDLAFETIGNATVIVHDRTPVLATDPWLSGAAYFGSWVLSHAVPEAQLEHIRACPFLWISHGHPDHLHMASLEGLRDQTILLADHVGGRIRDALTDDGYRVRVLPDRQWVPLTPRVRVMAIADVYQDSILLIDMDGTLIVNQNDCNDRGWGPTARRESRRAKKSILLALAGYGDADMINYFDEQGNRIPPKAARRLPPGPSIANKLRHVGADTYIPFATMHRYQREDSIWANEYTTPLDAFAIGFDPRAGTLLPAFVRYDVTTGAVTEIAPPENPIIPKPPTDFGDDWDATLADDELELVRSYFAKQQALAEYLDAIEFVVGGRGHEIGLGTATGRTVTFEVPAGSLIASARWEIFDDLLIGNFMRTTLHGDWPTHSLRPYFTATLAKYGDNGLAHTHTEVEHYIGEYRRRSRRDTIGYELDRWYSNSVRRLAHSVRRRVQPGSPLYELGHNTYQRARR